MDAPAVAVTSDGKKIAVAWMDTRAGNRDVQWTVATNGRFAPETTVHDATANVQGHPSLCFDAEGTAWCAWEDARGGPNAQRIYAANSKTRKNLQVSADAEGKAGYPTLASGGGLVGVTYEAGDSVAFRALAR